MKISGELIKTTERQNSQNIDNMKNFIAKIKRYLSAYLINWDIEYKEHTTNEFHKLYYELGLINKTWKNTKFLGYPVQKCPLDLFVYQEIVFNSEPDLIIETGTANGGTTLFLATILDSLNKGHIISIDIEKRDLRANHNRISYINDSSTAEETIRIIKSYIQDNQPEKVMVILDSNHTESHVSKELELYSEFVTLNSYLIVEDTNLNGNPVNKLHGPGPNEALIKFMAAQKKFIIETEMEKHLLTFNPGGYLKKISI